MLANNSGPLSPTSPLRLNSSQLLHPKLRHTHASLSSTGEYKCLITDKDFVSFTALRPCMEEIMYFNRVNGAYGTDVWRQKYCEKNINIKEVVHYGSIGLLDTGYSKFVIVITKRSVAAVIDRFYTIFKIEKVEMIQVSKYTQLFSTQRAFERQCLEAIHATVANQNLYFSNCDLTSTFQKKSQTPEVESGQEFFARLNDIYLWNKGLIDALDIPQKFDFVLPVICGHVQSERLETPDLKLVLISRASRHRVGTFYRRVGVDYKGRVAAHVETEMVLISHDYIASHVQMRGSIPITWELKLCEDKVQQPTIILDHSCNEDSIKRCMLHFESIKKQYGQRIIIIDLLNSKYESLSKAASFVYSRLGLFDKRSGVDYLAFARSQPPTLLSKLPRFIQEQLEFLNTFQSLLHEKDLISSANIKAIDQGYFLARKCVEAESVSHLQNGVYR